MPAAECWLPIEGWPYEVSDHGRVRRTSPACGTRPGRVLRLQRDRYGYLHVDLRHAPRASRVLVHHLVLVAFVGVAPGPRGRGRSEFQANHRDGHKGNNASANLEWVTGLENNRHAASTGLKARGSRHHNAVLDPTKVRSIRELLALGKRQIDIAREFRVSISTISLVKTGRLWGHVT